HAARANADRGEPAAARPRRPRHSSRPLGGPAPGGGRWRGSHRRCTPVTPRGSSGAAFSRRTLHDSSFDGMRTVARSLVRERIPSGSVHGHPVELYFGSTELGSVSPGTDTGRPPRAGSIRRIGGTIRSGLSLPFP